MRAAPPLLLLSLAPFLLGCHVPLRPYRLDHSAIIVPERGTGPALVRAPSKAEIALQEKPCINATDQPICLAFIEVDDMGELFDKAEVNTALRVIRQANDYASGDAKKAPIVITFVHGWKNNASKGNSNVEGFKLALQALYRRQPTRHVIGIYIGWRGDLIRASWPVARQFSYYNREAAAIRVPGASLTTALTQIAIQTHENKGGLAIFVGHSFGGLLLERTVSEATASQIAQATISAQEATAVPKGSREAIEKTAAAESASDSRADLVIFINPAGAATESKQFLNFLVNRGYRYRPTIARDVTASNDATHTTNREDDRPLFVSLTSTADMATKLALPIGHWWPDVKFKAAGSFRSAGEGSAGNYDLACFDPHSQEHSFWDLKTKADGAPDQSSYYLSTAPHMQVLQSHVMLKAIGADQMQVSSTGEKIKIQDPAAIAQCDRDLLNKQGLNIVSAFRLYDTQVCFAVQERPNRCNGTPYWMMEVDPDVVPDHGTIFTERFVQFLIDTFFQTPTHGLLERISPQLTMTQ